MNKSSLFGIPKDHFRTLYDAHTEKVRWRDLASQIVVPVACGGLTALSGAKLADVSAAVAGISIVAGLLFSMAVFLFQLRISLPDDRRLLPKDLDLIDECMKNTLWAIVWGLTLVLFLVVVGAGAWISSDGSGPILTGVAVGGSVHFLLVIGMCLKRLRRAYERIGMKRD